MDEHAVIVRFKHDQKGINKLYALEEKLEDVIDESGAGEYDGHEIQADLGNGTLYMYGPSADALFSVVAPILRDSSLMKGAVVTLRYGQADDTRAAEKTVEL